MNSTNPHEIARIRIQSWNEHVKEQLEIRLANKPAQLEHLTRLCNLKARIRFIVVDNDEIKSRARSGINNSLACSLS